MGKITHPEGCFQLIDGCGVRARKSFVEVRDDCLDIRGAVGRHKLAYWLEELPEVAMIIISITLVTVPKRLRRTQ